MKGVVFVGTLVFFVIAGLCSALLVATDWNSLASQQSFTGLGVLLFLIGAGIGAVFVLLCLWVLTKYRKQKNKDIEEANEKLPQPDSEKVNNDALEKGIYNISAKADNDAMVKGTYNIHAYHAQEINTQKGIKMSDASLLNKLGLGVKNAMHKVSLKMARRKSHQDSGVFSPMHKSWEKRTHSIDGIPAPTPRIYVLPPNSTDGASTNPLATTFHSRSRSGIPFTEKMAMPDATILEIDSIPKEEEELEETGSVPDDSSQSTETNIHETRRGNIKQLTSFVLPDIHPIDTHLDYFVQTLHQSKNRLTYMLSIMIEEVLPRPDSGLLQRMLRMSEIPVGAVEGSGEPILHLRVGSECHLSVGLIKINGIGSSPIDISGPHSIKLKPLDGEEMDLNTSCEALDGIEHVSSAFWDLKSHNSPSLTQAASGDSASTVLTPVEMTLVFLVHYYQNSDLIREVEVKKTFMASMKRELVSLDVHERFVHDDAVLDFVLSKMELISMPSLLMFLEVDYNTAISE